MHSGFISLVKVRRTKGEKQAKDAIQGVVCPQIIFNSNQEQKPLLEGGWVAETLTETGNNAGVYRYARVKHGWMNRGNLENVVVKEAYDDVMAKTTQFFAEHLTPESATSK
jgi:dienelactone hydrolase